MITSKAQYEANVLKHAFKDIVKDVDGYWYWWPTANEGTFSSAHLTVLAKILDDANRKWAKEVAEYFTTK